MTKRRYEMKPLFEERMRKLLKDDKDFEAFNEIVHVKSRNFIRANTLKIDPDVLFTRLKKKWDVIRPFSDYKEIMLVGDLGPGELGNAVEHLLGYFYVQEISSMMSVLALKPGPGDLVLDLCASPGSKTTQMAAEMENSGTIIANDIALPRMKILSANLERCGVSNTVVTRNDGVGLCVRLGKAGWKFDKILVDAPCSGEGTLRDSPKTFKMWNIKVVKSLGRQQKKLIANAFGCLKEGGELVYSTCTHAPEENEAVVDFVVKNFDVSVEKLDLPLKCRAGINEWRDNEYDKNVEKCCRIYPHDNDSEGFFVAKFRLREEPNSSVPQKRRNNIFEVKEEVR